MRAKLLRKLLQNGPLQLLFALQWCWETAPARSWLRLFLLDVTSATVFVPAVSALGTGDGVLPRLIKAIRSDLNWWVHRVERATHLFQQKVCVWVQRPRPSPLASSPPRLFVYARCGMCFAYRRALLTHLAQVHNELAPARYYIHSPACEGCMKYFHTVRAAQRHARCNPNCLLRLAKLFPKLDPTAICVLWNRKIDSVWAKLLQGSGS